jgi:hypothetical protein
MARRRTNRILRGVASLGGLTLCILALIGCKSPTDVPIQESIRVPEAELRFLAVPEMDPSVLWGSRMYDEAEISSTKGALLSVWYNGDEVDVRSKLRIFRGTVSQPLTVSLTLPEQVVESEADVVFGPDGLILERSAVLTMRARGLDLEGIDPDRVGFYYFNEDQGVWELIDPIFLFVNVEKGRIFGKCRVDHFSRYAVAER